MRVEACFNCMVGEDLLLSFGGGFKANSFYFLCPSMFISMADIYGRSHSLLFFAGR